MNETLNLTLNKEKKQYVCHYCNNNCYELCHTFDIIVDNNNIFVCEECIEKISEITYCYNCEEDIEAYCSVYICTKCPKHINTLCKKCNNLHNKIINIKH